MTLDSFKRDLCECIKSCEFDGRMTDVRPFVCDGSPLDCTIFLVGINPATSLEGDFWDFWEPDRGFNKEQWFEYYKKSRPASSPTRKNIDAFVEGTRGACVLETNIYAATAKNFKELDKSHQNTKIFEFLVETIRPKVIVVHGKPAKDAIAKLNIRSHVIAAANHFSRKTSRDTAKTLGICAALLASS